jgi:hypothetical protein
MIPLASVAASLVRQAAKRAVRKGLQGALKRAAATRLTAFDAHLFRASQGTLINSRMFSHYLTHTLKVCSASHHQMMNHFTDRIASLKSMGLLARHPAPDTFRFTRKGINSLKHSVVHVSMPQGAGLAASSLDVVLNPSLRSASRALLKREATRSVRKALKKQYTSRQTPSQNPRTGLQRMPTAERTVIPVRGKPFTPHQLEKLADLGTFKNLSLDQIGITYSDLRYLKKLGVLDYQTIRSKEGLERVVYLRQEGIRCVSDHTGRLDIHGGAYTKKPSEFYHDKKTYDAYQVLKRDIEAGGGRLQRVHTDLHLRSDYNAEGRAGYQLSDLRLEYTDANGELRTLEAEVDVGYSPELIAQKMAASPAMVWLTHSQAQAERIAAVATGLDHRVTILRV